MRGANVGINPHAGNPLWGEITSAGAGPRCCGRGLEHGQVRGCMSGVGIGVDLHTDHQQSSNVTPGWGARARAEVGMGA